MCFFILFADGIWEKILHGIAVPFIFALLCNIGQYNMQHKTQENRSIKLISLSLIVTDYTISES